MDARTDIESRLPRRHVTKGSSRALHRSYPGAFGLTISHAPVNAALQPASAERNVAEIFKKTPRAAGLQPRGRYVAKDMRQIGIMDADVATLNVKLTGADLAEHETKSQPRQTNGSGALWNYALQVRRAVDGVVTHPDGAYEKQCYADI